jgi:hypothetical protein
MHKKIAKTVLFVSLLATVFSAATVSARQLWEGGKGFAACGGSCGFNKPCPTGCLCIFPMESGSPFCSSHPIPGASLVK